MTREEFEALLEEAFEAGEQAAYEEIEDAIQESEMFESDDIEIEGLDESEEVDGYDEEAVLEALALRKRLNNVPGPKDIVHGIKGMASKSSSNFKKGVAAFRKRVLGKAGKTISKKYDDTRKKLIKAKAKYLVKKKSL